MTWNRASFLLCGITAIAMPGTMRAQNASIVVGATVQMRPLTLLAASRTSVPDELVIRLDGCGRGEIAVDARTATATRRTSRVVLEATASCAARIVMLHLPAGARDTLHYVVTLEQSDALLSPAFAQFVVPATVAGSRATVAY
jgi:hypothetical protein